MPTLSHFKLENIWEIVETSSRIVLSIIMYKKESVDEGFMVSSLNTAIGIISVW